jgi:hypothetical protein
LSGGTWKGPENHVCKLGDVLAGPVEAARRVEDVLSEGGALSDEPSFSSDGEKRIPNPIRGREPLTALGLAGRRAAALAWAFA